MADKGIGSSVWRVVRAMAWRELASAGVLLSALVACGPALAASAASTLAPPVITRQAPAPAAPAAPADLDEHVNRLTAELRCLVCQNQTIADSQAELAMQLKSEVRQQLAKGASDQQVLDFMVQRYGDFVLYRPPVNPSTWLLWAGPALLLLLAGILARLHWRERRAASLPDNDDDDANDDEDTPVSALNLKDAQP